MTSQDIVKDRDFSEVAQVRPDGKNRVTLKRIKHAGMIYKIYENSLGQIILDPQIMIPASEKWLYDDREALASVRRGIEQAGLGKVVRKPSLAKHADKKVD